MSCKSAFVVFSLSKGVVFEVQTRLFKSGRTSPPYTVATRRIFKPLAILNAAWRYQASNLFLLMSVNLARLAPS